MAGENQQFDTAIADQDIVKAFEDFLGSKKTDDVFVSILKDYSPKVVKFTTSSGEVQTKIKPPTGLRIGTFLKTLGLFFRKPSSTYNVLRFVRNQAKYNNRAFQRELIAGDALWSFVQNTAAKNLDKIGEMMGYFGIDVFAEGRMLDKQALQSMQSSMESSNVIQNMKQIAMQYMAPGPNYIKITASALKLVDESNGFRNFFDKRGDIIKEDITNYIKTAAAQEKSDLERWNSLDAKGKKKFLNSKGYKKEERNKILNAEDLPKGMGRMIADAGITLEDTERLLNIVPILLKRTGALGDIAETIDNDGLIEKANDVVTLFKGSRLDPKVLVEILEKLSEGDFIGVAEDSLRLMDDTPAMQKYLNDNKDIFAKITATAFSGHEAFKASGLSGDVVNIVPYLMNHPKELLEIIDLEKQGNFIEVGDKVLKLINQDKQIKDYFAKNTNGIKDFVMSMIAAEVQEQVRELNAGGLPEHNRIAVALDQYKLDIKDVGALMEVIPILLNQTDDFSKIIDQFRAGKYQDLVMYALDIVGPGQKINSYISENKGIFGKILEGTLKENPIFADVKGNVVDILPILISDPESLKAIIKQGIDNQTIKLSQTILDVIEKNQDLQLYLNNNREVMYSVAVKLLGIESYNIPKDVSDIMLNLTNPQNIRKIKQLLPLVAARKWDDLIIGAASMVEQDPAFAQSMNDNKDGFAKLINMAVAQIPAAKAYLGEAKTGKIVANLLSDPGSIRSIIEGWKKGYVAAAQAGTVAAVKSLINPEIRSGLIKQASRWWNGASEDNQAVVNSITGALGARKSVSDGSKIKLSELIAEVFDEVAENINDESIKHRLSKKVTRKVLFENTSMIGTEGNVIDLSNLEITGHSFVNTKLSNVSFENTDLRGVAFNNASFDNVDFRNSSMDAITFCSMRDEIVAGKVSLAGVRLVGDFIMSDLSDIDFSKMDLSGVTSLNASVITDSKFHDIKYPKDLSLFADTFGFTEANFNDERIADNENLNQRNTKFVASKIAEAISYKSANQDNDVLSDESKDDLVGAIEELLYDLSSLGERLRYFTSYSTLDLIWSNFPEDDKAFKDVADYRDKFSHMLTDIYENRHDSSKIEEALVSDIIASDVTKALFGEGANRGQDGLKIKKSIMTSVEQYSRINNISPRNILGSRNYLTIISQIVSDIYPRTLSTAAGMLARTGGIQLGPNTINQDLIRKFTEHMNIGAGIYEFTSRESEALDALAEKVADNVFGINAKKNRKSDFESIKATIEQSLYDIKSGMPGVELDQIITKHETSLVGDYSKSGLAKQYYDNTKSFGRGLSDDIHLNPFRNKLTTNIKEVIAKDLEIALKNQVQLDQSLLSVKRNKIQKRSFEEMSKLGNNILHTRG